MNSHSILLDNATLKYGSLALDQPSFHLNINNLGIKYLNPYIYSLNQLLHAIVLYDDIYYLDYGNMQPGWINTKNGDRIKQFIKPLKIGSYEVELLKKISYYRSQHFFKDPMGISIFTNMLDKFKKISPKKAPIPYLVEGDLDDDYFNPDFLASEGLLELYLKKRHFPVEKKAGIKGSFQNYYNMEWDTAVSLVYWILWKSNFYDAIPMHLRISSLKKNLIYSPAYSRSDIVNFPYGKTRTDLYDVFISTLRHMDQKYLNEFNEMTGINLSLVNFPNFILYLYKNATRDNILEKAYKMRLDKNVSTAKKYIGELLFDNSSDKTELISGYNRINEYLKKEWSLPNKPNYEITLGASSQNFSNLSFELSFTLAGELERFKDWLNKRRMIKSIKLFRSTVELSKEYRVIPEKYTREFMDSKSKISSETRTKHFVENKFLTKKEKKSLGAKKAKKPNQRKEEFVAAVMTWGT